VVTLGSAVQLTVNPLLVIAEEEMTGADGTGRNVVTDRVLDTALPPLFVAVTTTLYAVLGVKPVKTTDDPVAVISLPLPSL
jgi:hypothetical protein